MADAQLTYVTPAGWKRGAGYSHGLVVEGGSRVLFVAGQVATDRGGDSVVSDDFVAQWDQCLANVLAVVETMGGTAQNIAAMRIFVTDVPEYLSSQSRLGEPHLKHLDKHFPASTLVGVTGLVQSKAKIEMEAVVVL